MTGGGPRGANVLYIAGIGRSGSTLFARILGRVPGLVPVGELRFIWQRGFIDNGLCGCGQSFRDCGFWREVMERTLESLSPADVARINERAASLGSARGLPSFATLVPHGKAPGLRDHVATLARLYSTIADVSGRSWLIDTSKVSSYLHLLRNVPGINLFVIHLVRDSRGYVYSKARKSHAQRRPSDPTSVMNNNPKANALRWLIQNGSVQGFQYFSRNYLRIRYEDLAADPERHVRGVLRFIGLDDRQKLGFVDKDVVELLPDHAFSGNPNRFQEGAVQVRPDNEWQRSLAPGVRRTVTLVTLPLLLRYGYPIASKDAGKARR
jgi:hypothetical protein